MAVDAQEHALAVFEAFLRYARAGDVRARRPDAATASFAVLGSAGAGSAGVVRATVPSTHGAPGETSATERGTESDGADTEVTRVSPAPHAPTGAAEPVTAQGSPWEDPTRERPDVVRAMVALPEARPASVQSAGGQSAGGQSAKTRTVIARPVEERSIIVEDDTLTDPEFERSALLGSVDLRGSGRMPVEQFVQEMSILIKYGHATQAADETERWIASHPDDLAAQVQIAEFQLARLDRDAAIDRFVALVGRLVERGEDVQANDLVNRLRRDAPGDRRVGALAHRVGRG